jgi:hypothetical protein
MVGFLYNLQVDLDSNPIGHNPQLFKKLLQSLFIGLSIFAVHFKVHYVSPEKKTSIPGWNRGYLSLTIPFPTPELSGSGSGVFPEQGNSQVKTSPRVI